MAAEVSMPSHTISAIIAVHDGERTLERALRSVVGQSRPPCDIVVVDDGSSDESSAIARLFSEVRCVRSEHRGQAHALNLGVDLAQGDLLTFLDADDEWLPNKLATQLEALCANADLDMVFGHAEQVVDPALSVDRGVRVPSQRAQSLPARLPSAMMIRRSAFLRAGAFDPELRIGMVIEWYARARDAGLEELILPEVVYRRWIHGNNMGIHHAASRGEYAAVLKRILDRRRAAPADAGGRGRS
jgi:glycosyltransferase involved in cell wall biosynthesis